MVTRGLLLADLRTEPPHEVGSESGRLSAAWRAPNLHPVDLKRRDHLSQSLGTATWVPMPHVDNFVPQALMQCGDAGLGARSPQSCRCRETPHGGKCLGVGVQASGA